MRTRSLSVIITGTYAGEVTLSDTGILSFRYDEGYQGTPLSLSMPLSNRTYPQKTLLPYLLGLLPENDAARANLARRYDVGPDNAFALLRHIGLDCPGGVQFCDPSQLERVLERQGSYEPLTDEQIGKRLALLSSAESSWVGTDEHWSLGGNQGKFALAWHHDAWCSCEGSAPTTHIFKNGIVGYQLQALNEFFCMRLAEACGIPTARANYRTFVGQPAIIVQRFDRAEQEDGRVERLHQEDLCQVLSVRPSQKYTADGGPDTACILKLLATTPQARENAELFCTMLFYNCLIGAPDAHAKNYSLVLRGDDYALLAPLYDVASGLPYESIRRGGKLAMGIGGENRFGRMSRAALGRYVRSGNLERLGIDADWCASRMLALAEQITSGESALFESLDSISGISELRAHLEEPLLNNCTAIQAQLEQ